MIENLDDLDRMFPGTRVRFHERTMQDSKVHVEEPAPKVTSLEMTHLTGSPPVKTGNVVKQKTSLRTSIESRDQRARLYKGVRRHSALRSRMMEAMVPKSQVVVSREKMNRRMTSPDKRTSELTSGPPPGLNIDERRKSPAVSKYMERVAETSRKRAEAKVRSSYQMRLDSYIKKSSSDETVPPSGRNTTKKSYDNGSSKKDKIVTRSTPSTTQVSSPPVPSTVARKRAPMSALECLESLWVVFSWYSAWHFPGDLDHMADTAVFRFLSDTRLVKQSSTACLSPVSRHVTSFGHRSMTIADAQTLVHSLRLGRRRCRRTRHVDENMTENRKRWQRRVRAEHKGAVSNIMFKDFLILLDCLSAPCPYDVRGVRENYSLNVVF